MDTTELTREEVINDDPDEKMNLDKLVVGIPQEYLCQDMSSESIQAWSDAAECLASHSENVEVAHSSDEILTQRQNPIPLIQFLDSLRESSIYKVRPLLLLCPQPV